MKWSSAISEESTLTGAFEDCARRLEDELGGLTAHMIVAFVSPHYAHEYQAMTALATERFDDALLVGCSGGGVIGAATEVENRPALALTAAHLPNVQLTPFHIQYGALPDGDAPPDEWGSLVNTPIGADVDFLILADPFSMQGEQLLMGLDYAFPRSAKIGGLASGAHQEGGNALYLDDETYTDGVVGVAFEGDVQIDTVVAQGCRPIGELLHITSSRRNILLEVDGRTPFEVLKEIFITLDERDRELAQHSLFLGVVMDELNDDPKLGDFLIRNIVGVDAQRGALAVGEMLKEGQTVQFHLRDAETSSQDLSAMLEQYVSELPQSGRSEAGALLFQCLGRGSYLYGRPDHDTSMFTDMVGAVPLTGFFCNGEIGQVGDATFLHGYTSSFGIFRPKHRAMEV
ncbi:MAG: FIST C-terminal domain-containing protein [Chloroflexi bacterium]|nr:FIST C-terminal domain-containing protein [Chloroflexota bacterium]